MATSVHMGAVSAGSQAAVDAFDAGVADYLAMRGDPVQALQQACEQDDAFPLAHSVLASLLLLSAARTGADPAVAALRDHAARLAEAPDGTFTEKCHAAAVTALCDGKLRRAAALWEAALLEQPVDAVTSRLLHDVYLWLGDAVALRDSVARVMPRWEAPMPGTSLPPCAACCATCCAACCAVHGLHTVTPAFWLWLWVCRARRLLPHGGHVRVRVPGNGRIRARRRAGHAQPAHGPLRRVVCARHGPRV